MSFIGFDQAYRDTLEQITPLQRTSLPLDECEGYIAAEDIVAVADAPSTDVSLKDGYALRSADVSRAGAEHPVELRVIGLAGAGQDHRLQVTPSTAVRILTGARLPIGADAVIPEELTHYNSSTISVRETITVGRNVLAKGDDVASGAVMIEAGSYLTSGKVGLLAAGGIATVGVIARPCVALIATGDEVVLPGHPLRAGQLYASNLMVIDSWCRRYKMSTGLEIVADEQQALQSRLLEVLDQADAIITSGGAWTGERDVTTRALDALGWQKIYHRARLGPGKAVGFGLLKGKPVFVLPGGPPSNLVAFLLLALPGLLRLCGDPDPGLRQVTAIVSETIEGQIDWTQAVFGRISQHQSQMHFHPARGGNRFQDIGTADALVLIPEGVSRLQAGEATSARLLA